MRTGRRSQWVISISAFNFQTPLHKVPTVFIKTKGPVYCPKENVVKTSSTKSTATQKFSLEIGNFSKCWLFIQEFGQFYSNYTLLPG